MTAQEIEFGLDSLGEVSADPSGRLPRDAEAVRVMVDEAVLAETAGIDSYDVGEHYRPQHVHSAGHMILAAIARLSHEHRAASIELYGREVIPRVRQLLEALPGLPVASGQHAAVAKNARSRA